MACLLYPFNSQQLCLPAQDLHEIKPVKIPAWLTRTLAAPHLSEELLEDADCLEREAGSLSRTWLLLGYSYPREWSFTHVSMNHPNWRQIGGLKRGFKAERETGRGIGERQRWTHRINIYCINV